jgi:hypothetical protein
MTSKMTAHDKATMPQQINNGHQHDLASIGQLRKIGLRDIEAALTS